MIKIEDFARVDLRVGRVLKAERIEKSQKLLELLVDLGEIGQRTIVAGLAAHYPPENLVNKFIVVVANLEPALLRGVRSEGMLLAAVKDEQLALLTLDRAIEPGSKIC